MIKHSIRCNAYYSNIYKSCSSKDCVKVEDVAPKAEVVKVQTVAGNNLRGTLDHADGGIYLNRDGFTDRYFIPNHRIVGIRYF